MGEICGGKLNAVFLQFITNSAEMFFYSLAPPQLYMRLRCWVSTAVENMTERIFAFKLSYHMHSAVGLRRKVCVL